MVDNSRTRYASVAEQPDDRVVQPVFPSRDVSRDVSMRDIVLVVRERRALCFTIIAICSLLALAAAVLMTPVYRTEVLLFPVERETTAGSSLLRQFGGIAALAGVKSGSSKQTDLAVATLRSHEFTADFIERNNVLPALTSKPGVIARLLALVRTPKPMTVDGAAEYFRKGIEKVEIDPQSEAVKLTVEFRDRLKTAEWANQLVAQINDQMRTIAITQSRSRLEFLNDELKKTNVVGVQGAIFSLMENEMKNIMLANTERDFAFVPVEHPKPSGESDFVRPQRVLLILCGVLAGVVLSLVICLFVAATSVKTNRLS